MAYARTTEHFPLGFVDGALVAHHQGNDDARIRTARQCGVDPISQHSAETFDRMMHARNEGSEPAAGGSIIGTHIAGGSYALFQQPYFIIEAVGIGVSVRALKAYVESPALAGRNFRRRAICTIRRIPGH